MTPLYVYVFGFIVGLMYAVPKYYKEKDEADFRNEMLKELRRKKKK